ncbi:hypothetical protein LPJ61_006354, partial [Coemansia biformis]
VGEEHEASEHEQDEEREYDDGRDDESSANEFGEASHSNRCDVGNDVNQCSEDTRDGECNE